MTFVDKIEFEKLRGEFENKNRLVTINFHF